MCHEDNQKYQKAKYDLIKAYKSIQELTDYQKERLAYELFGSELIYQFVKLLESYKLRGQ